MNWNAPLVKLSHDETVTVVDYFNALSCKVERKVAKRFGYLSVSNEQRIADWANNEVKRHFGFKLNDLFATPAN